MRAVFSKYLEKIPDIKDQLIIDERLSRAISHYFKGKISPFPLYKVSVTIDRNPVKIPWTLEGANTIKVEKPKIYNGNTHKQYIYISNSNLTGTRSHKKLYEKRKIRRPDNAHTGKKQRPNKNKKNASPGNKKLVEKKILTIPSLNTSYSAIKEILSPKIKVVKKNRIADERENITLSSLITEKSEINSTHQSLTTEAPNINTTEDVKINTTM